MTREELRDRWDERRGLLQRLGGVVDGPKIIGEFLADLADLIQSEDEALLTLRQAADRSGYSLEHLGRLVRTGRLPNVGRRGAPRIRTSDLPVKTVRALTGRRPLAYDIDADARALRGGRQ